MPKEQNIEQIIQDFFDSAIQFLEESKYFKHNSLKKLDIDKNIKIVEKMKTNPAVKTAFKERYNPDNGVITKDGFIKDKDESVYIAFNFVILAIDEYYNGKGDKKERQNKVLDFIQTWIKTKAEFRFPTRGIFGLFKKKQISEEMKHELIEQHKETISM